MDKLIIKLLVLGQIFDRNHGSEKFARNSIDEMIARGHDLNFLHKEILLS